MQIRTEFQELDRAVARWIGRISPGLALHAELFGMRVADVDDGGLFPNLTSFKGLPHAFRISQRF